MTGLEQTFYIVGIIFMGLMLLLLVALVAAVFVIRAKINHIHKMVDEKINTVSNLVERGGEIAGAVLSNGKKVLNKK